MPKLTNQQLETLRQTWIERVSEFHASGQTQTAWCRANQVPVRQLRYWLRKFSLQGPGSNSPTPAWVSIELDDSKNEVSSQVGLAVRVGSAVIEVQEGFNPSLLLSVVKALQSLC